MSKSTDTAQQDPLQAEFKALIEDAERLLQNAASLAGEQADELRQHIQLNLQRARNTLAESGETVRQQGDAVRQAGETYVQQNPWQALGIAAGIGLLLGLLLGRR
ncbi:MAG: hypothetical protein CFE49_18495 [Pseudomonas sp. PGPPP3]|nr:MAG: hypothetical protein CFE49_18495 [Pseudomonas sp. PGPPP3]